MSFAGALERAKTLRVALLDHGVRAVSIELQQGRPGTPNDRWFDRRFIGVLGHHIVSTRSMGLTPGLALVKRGRTDVPGPLCNGYGGFDEIARLICMGWANHPGEGGPLMLPGGTIPEDQGRPYLFGWEHEGGVRLSDWTDSFRTFMGRCHAGTLDWLDCDERSYGEHKTWAPDRKIDRLGYTTATGRAEAARYLGDDDMTVDELLGTTINTGQGPFKVATLLANAALLPTVYSKANALAAAVAQIADKVDIDDTELAAIQAAAQAGATAALDPEAVAVALAPLLPAVDQAELSAALREVLGSVDNV